MFASNMSPFKPFNFKGSDKVDGVPVFIDKLPATAGGIAGEDDMEFGLFVSVNQAKPNEFKLGLPASGGYVGVGLLISDPTIMTADPGMNNKYYKGRPATAAIFGMIEMHRFATGTGLSSPLPGSKVYVKRATGELAFTAASATALSTTDYALLENYTVIPSDYGRSASDGYRIWVSPVAGGAATTTALTAPTITPEAGAKGTDAFDVTISNSVTGSTCYYTIDGTEPTLDSDVLTEDTLVISVKAPVTVKAKVFKPGYAASATTSVAYTTT